MKNVKIVLSSLLLGSLLLTTSCSSDDDSPEQGHHHDEATLIEVTVTDAGGNEEIYEFHAEEHDHDHKTSNGKEDDHEEIVLLPNSEYTVKVRLLNDDDPNDIEDVTPEFLEEKDEHFITFSKEESLDLTIERTDGADATRADGNKLGFSTEWSTGAASEESHVELKLYHEPEGVSSELTGNGNDFGSVTSGETEVDIEIVVAIEEPSV